MDTNTLIAALVAMAIGSFGLAIILGVWICRQFANRHFVRKRLG